MAKKIWNADEKLQFERALQAKGCKYIAGVDEVGRGPLAGPVVCAAVIMPLEEADLIVGVDDSKKVSAKKREQLAEMIKEKALAYTIFEVDEKTIDEINILEATKLGMKKAVGRCPLTRIICPFMRARRRCSLSPLSRFFPTAWTRNQWMSCKALFTPKSFPPNTSSSALALPKNPKKSRVQAHTAFQAHTEA